MTHNDVIDIGVIGRELFCPHNLKGIGVGCMMFVVVVVAVVILDGIVLFSIAGTPAIAESIA